MKNSVKTQSQISHMREALLRWYDEGGRALPWRIRPEDRAAGIIADPYAVWLSEIMLQQTTVAHATPYWEKFLSEFPSVTDLADAPRDRVLTMWAGLGYYARARNLHKCAVMVRDEHGGAFPSSEALLLKLPGIGAYSAAAIAAICFGEATNIVDGNVERVISRIFAVQNPLPKAKSELRSLAGTLADPKRAGDYGQAIMDLGATICVPRNPKCAGCVWSGDCAAKRGGDMETYPRKIKKKTLPTRYGAAFWVQREEAVLIRQRPDKGLLGGMMEFPSSAWSVEKTDEADWLSAAPFEKNWEKLDGTVTHIFTHFRLELTVYRAAHKGETEDEAALGVWADITDLKNYALPSVMVKVVKLARG